MKWKLLVVLCFICGCGKNEETIGIWIRNSANIDTVKIVPKEQNFADIDDFQIKGFTLEQVESLYGKSIGGLGDCKGVIVEDELGFIEGYDYSDLFSKSDYPITIKARDWKRDEGRGLRVFFVEYKGKWIAFDAFQTFNERLRLE